MKRLSVYLCIVAVGVLMSAVFADSGFAQAPQAQSQAYSVIAIKVKSGMAWDFAAFMKNELVPLMKKSGVNEMQTWSTAFGDADEWDILIPLKSMAELDRPSFFDSFGQYERAVFAAKLERLVAGIAYSVIATQPELTIAPKPGYAYKIGTLMTNTVAIDRDEDFVKSSKAVMNAVAKTNAKAFVTSTLSLGGDLSEYYTLCLFDSYADLEKFGPAYGKALMEAKLAPQSGIVTKRELKIVRYLPNLSIEPVAP
jgi:hypothetical protein